jgi:hypothetical protein
MFSVLSRKSAQSDVAPDPGYYTSWMVFMTCAAVLVYIERLIMPASIQAWLADLAGPHRSRDLGQAILFLGPLVVLYAPFYYYVFWSKGGREQQARFEMRVAPELDENLGKWRLILFCVWIVSMFPGALSSYWPLPSAIASLLLIAATSEFLKHRFRAVGV